LLTAILKYKRQLKCVGAVLALAASITLVWFTVNSPERGRNVLATAMEKD
jgi:hypothetical protein